MVGILLIDGQKYYLSVPTLNNRIFFFPSLNAISALRTIDFVCFDLPIGFCLQMVFFLVKHQLKNYQFIFVGRDAFFCFFIVFNYLNSQDLLFNKVKYAPLVSQSLPVGVYTQNGLYFLCIQLFINKLHKAVLILSRNQLIQQRLNQINYYLIFTRFSFRYNFFTGSSQVYLILLKYFILTLSLINNLQEFLFNYLIKNIDFNNKSSTYMFIQIIFLSLIIDHARSVFQPATWTVNPLLNSGEHKAIFNTNKAPSTFTATPQPYNNNTFGLSNRVVLSLQGYLQNAPCNGCQVGFKITNPSTTLTQFTVSVTVYGANMYFLFYMYLVIANTATQYFPSYNIKQYSSGNLIDTSSSSRSVTEILNNPAGQSFPTFPTNTISNIIFLAGFKMNMGTTGTYINLTSSILSSTTHSVTIATKADVQIYQVCYFRLAFDKTAIMQGYVNIIDSFYFWGVNSSQMPTNTTLRPAPVAQYRNFLMGLTHINLPTVTQGTDMVLQLLNSTNTLFTFTGLLTNSTATPPYQYFYADIFHHRKRVCANTSISYYYYVDEICYDICPERTYGISTTFYCQKCHFSCLTCSGSTNVTCVTCSSNVDFRQFVSSNSSCTCRDGYLESGVSVCLTCIPTCKTCSLSIINCITCDEINHFRQHNSTVNTCECKVGYFQTSFNTPTICNTCDSNNCLSCASSATRCTSCDQVNKFRTLNSTTNTCECKVGYFQTSFNTPTICNTCDSNCLSCASSATRCTSCDQVNKFRTLNSTANTCSCINGYYQNITAVPSVCQLCHITCLTCSGALGTQCLSCNTTIRNYVNNSCLCNSGTQQPTTIDGTCTPIPPITVPICGNGIVEAPQACDDNNTISQDGCSSSCAIQPNHNCIQSSTGTKSVCYYNKPLDMTIQSVLKVLNDNKVDVVILIEALLCNMAKLKQYLDSLTAIKLQSLTRLLFNDRRITATSQIISITNANFVITDATNYKGYLSITLSYTQTIPTLQNRKLSFISTQTQLPDSNKNYFISTPITYISLQDPYNKIPMQYYSIQRYNSVSGLSYVFLVINCINLLYFVVMAVLGRSAIAVEGVIVFQVCYFCVLGLDTVELAVASLAVFGKYCTGININIISSNLTEYNSILQYNSCSKMPKIYQQCNAIDNINITFYIATVMLMIAFGVMIYKNKRQKQLDQMVISATESQRSNYDSNRSSNQPKINANIDMNMNNSIQYSMQQKKYKRIHLTYQLPQKINKILISLLQLSFGMYFLTAIQYLLSAVNLNQNQDGRIASIVWLVVVGLLFVFLWVVWYRFYPIRGLSYVGVLKQQIQKLSIVKIYYTVFFVFLVLWGAILGSAPAILSYIILILWAIVCIYWCIHKKIYQTRILNFRSILNQIYIILIAINFIILQYAVNDGLGLISTGVLLTILLLSSITNISMDLYNIRVNRYNEKKLKQNLNQLRSQQQYFKNQRPRDNKSINYQSNKKNHTKSPHIDDRLKNIDEIKIQITQRKLPFITSRMEQTERIQKYSDRPDRIVHQQPPIEEAPQNSKQDSLTIQKKVNQLKNVKKQIKRITIPNNSFMDGNQTKFHTLNVQSIKASTTQLPKI